MFCYKKNLLVFTCLLIVSTSTLHADKKPRLTVIFVIDQFAYHYWTKLDAHFKYGLKTLADKGLFYKNPYFPHGGPATATGHTALNTGVYAKDHGIVGNSWINRIGKKIACDEGDATKAAVFTATGSSYNHGKSAQHIMTDGISDQFVLADTPQAPHYAYSVSVKSRAAICTANKLGKALWIDSDTGLATTSKAYFPALPAWVMAFNKQQNTDALSKTDWKLAYEPGSSAYRFNNLCNYVHANARGSLLGKKPTFAHMKKHKKEWELFFSTPQANELTFRLAKECMKQHISAQDNNNLLLWVCISGLDKAGHMFGPESVELIDMIYHLDKQLQDFMDFSVQHIQSDNVLFCLTADHGIEYMTELLHKKGLDGARRIQSSALIACINKHIEKAHGAIDVIHDIKQPNVHLNCKALDPLPANKQAVIIADIKEQLLKTPGIKTVWTYQELRNATFTTHQLENYFKQQLFPNRSGDLIIQTYPYVIMNDDEYTRGTSHQTPYEYDTHVPLILYNKSIDKPKTIYTKVWTLQLANTLAQVLQVSKPSSSTFEALPGSLEYLL
jgi:hypothetical protein